MVYCYTASYQKWKKMHAINRQDFINVCASAVLFAVVLGVGHTDSLALNKH